MSDYAYKPRLGFDIRIRPPTREAQKPWWTEGDRKICEHEGCRETAQVAVSRTPREPGTRVWLCAAHATEHNRRWNYFEGLSEAEAEQARMAASYGDRPTWSFARNERARSAAKARGPADFVDPFGFFAGFKARTARPEPRERAVSKLQAKAFETLGLPLSARRADIRRRYAELLRRFHPDANGGDRGAEAQLAEVVKAYQLLKKARLC